MTLTFWITKILATTFRETAGDFVSMSLNLGYDVGLAITFTALIVILSVRIGFRGLHPAIFWLGISTSGS